MEGAVEILEDDLLFRCFTLFYHVQNVPYKLIG